MLLGKQLTSTQQQYAEKTVLFACVDRLNRYMNDKRKQLAV